MNTARNANTGIYLNRKIPATYVSKTRRMNGRTNLCISKKPKKRKTFYEIVRNLIRIHELRKRGRKTSDRIPGIKKRLR